MEEFITITIDEFKDLKRLYNKAKKSKKNQFQFKNRELLMSYAKYLIEYLESKFEKI